jgi:hypothetical protein
MILATEWTLKEGVCAGVGYGGNLGDSVQKGRHLCVIRLHVLVSVTGNGNGNGRYCSSIHRIAPCARRAPNGPPRGNASSASLLYSSGLL